MAVAYLMNLKNWSRDQALEFVANMKDDICPNINFCYQLLQLEPHIRTFYKKADQEGITTSEMDTDSESMKSTSPPQEMNSQSHACEDLEIPMFD